MSEHDHIWRKYYQAERDRAEACLADIFDLAMGEGSMEQVADRLELFYSRADGQ